MYELKIIHTKITYGYIFRKLSFFLENNFEMQNLLRTQDSDYSPYLSGRYSSISSMGTSKNLHKASRTSKEIAAPFPLDNLKAVAYAMLALRIRSVSFKPRCLSNSGTLTLITDHLLRNTIWRICAKARQKAKLST